MTRKDPYGQPQLNLELSLSWVEISAILNIHFKCFPLTSE
uniref:Uncharacterized protein n=1 Tax=Rhizophora mucronata TaxID=61149 RepID=A0A2P2M1S5_RHIMU